MLERTPQMRFGPPRQRILHRVDPSEKSCARVCRASADHKRRTIGSGRALRVSRRSPRMQQYHKGQKNTPSPGRIDAGSLSKTVYGKRGRNQARSRIQRIHLRIPTVYLGKLLLLGLSAGCASTAEQFPSQVETPPDPVVAQAIIDSTALRRPMHIVFGWNFTEENARFSGQGAARVQPPYHARLDLFGPRGETYLAAAAVADELRLPPGLPDALKSVVPPIALLWSALGVVRAPEGATLDLTSQSGDTTTVGYARNNERWRFRAVRGRLQYAEWQGPDRGRRTVELRGTGPHDLPAVAVYRDWLAFRELTLTLDRANETAGFPPDTWQPGS